MHDTECIEEPLPTPANGSIWSLGWIGGDVVNRSPRNATAYVHRNMLTLLRPTPVWPNDAPSSVGDGLMSWTNDVIAALAPYTPNESYQNFPHRAITHVLRRKLRHPGRRQGAVRSRQSVPKPAEYPDTLA